MSKILKQQMLDSSSINIQALEEPRFFTLEEANNLISTKIMGEAQWFTSLYDKSVVNFYKTREKLSVLDEKLNHIKKMWEERIKGFGAIPEGMGVVDFDAGDNLRFCWKYYNKQDSRFEKCILYWHKVGGGFTGRIPIKDFPKRSAKEPGHRTIQLFH